MGYVLTTGLSSGEWFALLLFGHKVAILDTSSGTCGRTIAGVRWVKSAVASNP